MGFFKKLFGREDRSDAFRSDAFIGLLAATVPRDRNGKAVFLDSVVYRIQPTGARLCLVVAMSHHNKLCVRPIERDDGRGGKWVDAAECVVARTGAK